MKKQLKQEYIFKKVPTSLLWKSISTTNGLAEWFADSVHVDGDLYTFKWDEEEQQAILRQSRSGVYMRFHWVDDPNPKTFFEIRISVDQLTRDVILTVTDFADDETYDETLELWDMQVDILKDRYAV